MKIFSYIPSYTVPISAVIGIYLGGFWTFITPVYIFLLLPLAEWVAGENKHTLSLEEEEKTKASLGYSLLLWSHVPIQYVVTGYFLWMCGFGHLTGWSLVGAIEQFCQSESVMAVWELR